MTQYYDILDKFGDAIQRHPTGRPYTFLEAFTKVRDLNKTGKARPYRYIEVIFKPEDDEGFQLKIGFDQ